MMEIQTVDWFGRANIGSRVRRNFTDSIDIVDPVLWHRSQKPNNFSLPTKTEADTHPPSSKSLWVAVKARTSCSLISTDTRLWAGGVPQPSLILMEAIWEMWKNVAKSLRHCSEHVLHGFWCPFDFVIFDQNMRFWELNICLPFDSYDCWLPSTRQCYFRSLYILTRID